MDRWYAALVTWSLRHRAVIAGVTVLVFLSTVPLFVLVLAFSCVVAAASYHLVELPFLRLIQSLFNGIVIASLLAVGVRYLVAASRGELEFTTPIRVHLGVLVAQAQVQRETRCDFGVVREPVGVAAELRDRRDHRVLVDGGRVERADEEAETHLL